MPIDPSIPLSVKTPEPTDPFAMYRMILAIQQQGEQMRQQRDASKALAEERRMAVAERQQKLTDIQSVDRALARPGDREGILAALPGHLRGVVQKSWDEADLAAENVKAKRKAASDAEADYFGSLADGVEQYVKSDPEGAKGALMVALTHAKSNGHDISKVEELIQQNPDAMPQLLAALKSASPKYQAMRLKASEKNLEPYTLNPGDVRMQGEQVVASNPKPHEPKERVPAAVGSFEDYVARYAQAKGKTPDALTTGDIEDARKRYQQADDRPKSAAPASAAIPDDDGLDLLATMFRLTGKTVSRDSKQNAAIATRAAKQTKELGDSPAAMFQKQAAYKADGAALQDVTKRAASAEAFESKALGQIPIIEALSAKVSRTSMPLINQAIQAGRTEITGDTNATQLANAIETFTEEYAKIMGGSTGSAAGATDSSRAAAKRLLNTAMSKGTMSDVLTLMQREMSLTMQGYDATKQHITERMGGGPSAGAKKADPLGIR